MKFFLFFIKSLYYLILLSLFIFLGLFPSNEYWNLISNVFFGLIGIGYLLNILLKNISIEQLMKHGLTYFVIGVVISTIGIFVGGEILFKLSFLVYMLGILGSFINYNKRINE